MLQGQLDDISAAKKHLDELYRNLDDELTRKKVDYYEADPHNKNDQLFVMMLVNERAKSDLVEVQIMPDPEKVGYSELFKEISPNDLFGEDEDTVEAARETWERMLFGQNKGRVQYFRQTQYLHRSRVIVPHL